MKEPQPEFSRLLPIDRVPQKGSVEKISAEPKECTAIAKRLNVPELNGLKAQLKVTPWRGGGVKVTGRLLADLDQVSVVSLEQFRSELSFEVERYFLPPQEAPLEDAEGDLDIDVIQGGTIDLGEIVVETLGLELDPYPRKDGEDFQGFESVDEPEIVRPTAKVSPFAALKALKDKAKDE